MLEQDQSESRNQKEKMDKRIRTTQPSQQFPPNPATYGRSNSQNESHRHVAKGSKSQQHGYPSSRTRERGNSNYNSRQKQAVERNQNSCDEVNWLQQGGRKKKTGSDASHLLNFNYGSAMEESRTQRRGPPTNTKRTSRWQRSGTVITKEQYLQANCQFLVNLSEDDCQQFVSNPDLLVDWEKIQVIRLYDDQVASCPICLEVPVSARITKCAHIYCYPCILHFISLSEKSWSRCPICNDHVELDDLKSVETIRTNTYNIGDQITFDLMRRERGTQYVRPVNEWMRDSANKLYNLNDSVSDVRLSKLLHCQLSDIETNLEQDRKQLLKLLSADDTETLESSFVQAAINNVAEKLNSIRGNMKPSDSDRRDKTDDVENESCPVVLSQVKSSVDYIDAFDDISAPQVTANLSENDKTNTACSGVSSDQTVYYEEQNYMTPDEKNRERNSNSTSSSGGSESVDPVDSMTADEVAAELLLPPTGVQPARDAMYGAAAGQRNQRKEVYYFYQSSDGQQIYIHSVNARILASQYGSMESTPHTITATVVEVERATMSPELRKRLKYLAHIPLYSQFSIVEVALRPPLVSSKVIQHFREELDQRKRTRARRNRMEKQQQRKAEFREKREMARFPDMRYSQRSEMYCLVNNPEPSPVVVQPTTTAVQPDEQPPTTSADGDNAERKTVCNTPYSFANAIRAGAASAPTWPRVQTQTGKPNTTTNTAADGEDGEEQLVAPSYQQSFNADFDAAFKKLEVKKKEAADGSDVNKGKGKKKRVRMVPLFSNAGGRP